MNLNLDPFSTIIIVLGFSYTLALGVWAWHAITSERHLREQLERVNLFFDEQMITNDRYLDKLTLIETKVNILCAEMVAANVKEKTNKLLEELDDSEPTRDIKSPWF